MLNKVRLDPSQTVKFFYCADNTVHARRHVRSHVHVPTHVQNSLHKRKIALGNDTFTCPSHVLKYFNTIIFTIDIFFQILLLLTISFPIRIFINIKQIFSAIPLRQRLPLNHAQQIARKPMQSKRRKWHSLFVITAS